MTSAPEQLPILSQLNIESRLLIWWNGAPWQEQGLYRAKSETELKAIIAAHQKPQFVFNPLEIKESWYLTLKGCRVGPRLDHGSNGKKGLSFPMAATQFHDSYAGAEAARTALAIYFNDLALNKRYGGEIVSKDKNIKFDTGHFFLYD